MTIRIEVTDPHSHKPEELSAVVHFLNCVIADKGGRVSSEVPTAAPLASAPQASSVAPGASSQSETGEDADASAACDTSKLDSDGIAWDERIHSETKNQNKDGTWRLRRNVDKALVDQVIAEQRGAATADDTPPPPPAEDAAPELPPETPATATADDTPPPAPVSEDVKPADVIKFISANKLDQATVNAMVEPFGLTKAAELFAKPQLAGDVMAALQTLVG